MEGGEPGPSPMEQAEAAEIYKNNHDLIGIDGIVKAQQLEIENKKLELRMQNERYYREHPEIQTLISVFVRKVLDERPENILEFAGSFFDRAELKDIVEECMKCDQTEAKRNEYLNNLMKGKAFL